MSLQRRLGDLERFGNPEPTRIQVCDGEVKWTV